MNIKAYFIVIAGLLLIPGCGKRKKTETVTQPGRTVAYKPTGPKSIYDENVEAFVLEGDPFATPQAGQSIRLVEDESSTPRRDEFETIYYDFDRYEIRGDQKPALKRNVAKIKEHAAQGHIIMIEGHACTSGGSAKYNMSLSEKRSREIAKQVKDYLVSQGVPAQSLKTVGRGSEMCIVVGGDREQQAPNRRVEFYVLES